MSETPDQPHLPAMDDWEPPESSQSKFERDNRDCEYWSAEMGECALSHEWCDANNCLKEETDDE